MPATTSPTTATSSRPQEQLRRSSRSRRASLPTSPASRGNIGALRIERDESACTEWLAVSGEMAVGGGIEPRASQNSETRNPASVRRSLALTGSLRSPVWRKCDRRQPDPPAAVAHARIVVSWPVNIFPGRCGGPLTKPLPTNWDEFQITCKAGDRRRTSRRSSYFESKSPSNCRWAYPSRTCTPSACTEFCQPF